MIVDTHICSTYFSIHLLCTFGCWMGARDEDGCLVTQAFLTYILQSPTRSTHADGVVWSCIISFPFIHVESSLTPLRWGVSAPT
jgi:hypothetical protein